MTRQQYRRMAVFALRMAPTAIKGARWKQELLEHIRKILDRINGDNYGIHYSTIKDWDHPHPVPGDDGTCGFAWSHSPYLLCDFVATYCWDRNWNYNSDGKDSARAIALNCCIRAACDVAVSPSAGVVGWTVQDIKAMWYPKPVPQWVKQHFAGDFDSFSPADAVWL